MLNNKAHKNMIIEAKNLKLGDKYLENNCIFQVVEIVKISDLSINFRIDRIYPIPTYVKNWKQRKRLNTKVELSN